MFLRWQKITLLGKSIEICKYLSIFKISEIIGAFAIKRDKFNEYSRQCFLYKFLFQAILTKFEEMFIKQNIDLRCVDKI
jgi:hypothetical protein